MQTKYGFSLSSWESAKKEAQSILVKVACRKECIAYSELTTLMQAIDIEPHNPNLFHFLGEISIEENQKNIGMLTAIVVHKNGDMQPGKGFFDLAQSLGRDTSDIVACWINECNFVYDYWGK